jgi:dihydrofolate reductase
MKLCAIVAVSENGVIGSRNQLPWKISEDLKHFKKLTLHHSIIMGRKTFESLGRVLPDRFHIVISKSFEYAHDSVQVVKDLDSALILAESKSKADEEVFVIGGSQIYELSFSRIERFYLTLVNRRFEGDAFFSLDRFEREYRVVSRQPCQQESENGLSFHFLVADRIQSIA